MKNFGYKCLIIKNTNAIKYLKRCKSQAVKDFDSNIRALQHQNRIYRFRQIVTLLKSVIKDVITWLKDTTG